MSNRSLLLAVDSIPEPGKPPGRVRGLSEWSVYMSTAQTLLVSATPRLCQSVIWPEHRIGIAGDYDAGVDKLLAFLDAFGKLGELPDDLEYQEAVAETRRFLTDPQNRDRHVLLELGETLDPGAGGSLEDEAERYLTQEIPQILSQLEPVISGSRDLPPWLARELESSGSELGLYWTDVLYHDARKG